MINGKDAFVKFGHDVTTVKWQSKNMVFWDVPEDIRHEIPALPKRLFVNKLMVVPLEKGFRNLIAAGIASELKTWDGCFTPRAIRGYEKQFQRAVNAGDFETASKYASLHYWALAFDVNYVWNKLGAKPTLSKKFVQCFVDAGFDWGGYFKRLDGMHFQLASLS